MKLTFQELRKKKGIKNENIKKIMSKQTYYYMISGEHSPNRESIKNICKVFGISERTFKIVLKNTLKKAFINK